MEPKKNKTGIIIQVRVGSTRLENKMIKSFYEGRSILEILLERFKKENHRDIPFVIATTTKQSDNAIESLSETYEVPVYRGSEENVLQRFIEAAKQFEFDKIVRICADNPLLDINGTLRLYNSRKSDNWDYLGYRIEGDKPSILSHSGFWGEWVTLSALEKVYGRTREKIYREHVTNFIYTHPRIFNVELHDAPLLAFHRNDIRLTVDRKEDFDLVAEIYRSLQSLGLPLTVANIIRVIDDHPVYLEQMSKQIMLNKK